MCGQYSTPIADSDHRFLLSNACRWEALKAMQGGGWYMAQSIYDLWDLLQVQSTVLILPNGLETDLHRTEPSNLLFVSIPNGVLASCSFVPKSLPFISLYIPAWFYHTCEEWTNWCLYLAQKLGSCFNVSFSEAVDFIFSHCMVLVHRYYFLGHAGIVLK